MDGVKDNVMIALLPITTDWSTLELPHLTLAYCGKISDHTNSTSDFNSMAKDAASLAALSSPISLNVLKQDVFGPPYDLVSVYVMRPSVELMAMRNFVKDWDQSEFTKYTPHCTIGPYPGKTQLDYVPRQLAFDRIMVGWGEDQVVFSLR